MRRALSFTCAALLGVSPQLSACEGCKADSAKPIRVVKTSGLGVEVSAESVQAQAKKWLAGATNDPETLKKFDAIWSSDGSLHDRVVETIVLGDPKAAELLAQARDVNVPAPMAIPAILTAAKNANTFHRANLALAYAKLLTARRIHEEALAVLDTVHAKDVAEPGTYFFHKAVAEFAMTKHEQAARSISALEEIENAPARYKIVAAMMFHDMQTWKEKDLGWVARKMDNIERRLDLARGGMETQKIQKEVIAALDKMIEELEQPPGPPGPNPPPPGPPGPPAPPMFPKNPGEPPAGGQTGEGKVDEKKFKEMYKNWGTLPEKARAEAIANAIRSLPPHLQEAAKDYFDRMNRESR